MPEPSQPFTNARVHGHLEDGLDATAISVRATRMMLISAALWWFLMKMTPAERAEALGEYVKERALRGQAEAEAEEQEWQQAGRQPAGSDDVMKVRRRGDTAEPPAFYTRLHPLTGPQRGNWCSVKRKNPRKSAGFLPCLAS
jgi:hypothetical protein